MQILVKIFSPNYLKNNTAQVLFYVLEFQEMQLFLIFTFQKLMFLFFLQIN